MKYCNIECDGPSSHNSKIISDGKEVYGARNIDINLSYDGVAKASIDLFLGRIAVSNAETRFYVKDPNTNEQIEVVGFLLPNGETVEI